MSKIVGLYLAAGGSTRMGCNKLALPLGDGTLGGRALRAACSSQLDEVLVLTREHDALDWLQTPATDTVEFRKVRQVNCHDACLGQSHTLRCGIQAAEHIGAQALVVMLADQPFVPASMIDDLISTFLNRVQEDSNTRCVAASARSIPRPPILFSRLLFPVLKQLQGDEGARSLFRDGLLSPVVIEYSTAACFHDIDTPADYEAIKLSY